MDHSNPAFDVELKLFVRDYFHKFCKQRKSYVCLCWSLLHTCVDRWQAQIFKISFYEQGNIPDYKDYRHAIFWKFTEDEVKSNASNHKFGVHATHQN